jgi:hypothetical protein
MAVTPPMNPQIKARWVQWLRDNVDNQGIGTLNDSGRFCCLGGLCELALQDGIVDFYPNGRDSAYGPPNSAPKGWADALLPQVVSEWAGLDGEDNPVVMAIPEGGEERDEICMTGLNDEWGYNFNQIADLIEEQL